MVGVGHVEMERAEERAKETQTNVYSFASLVNSHVRQLALKRQEKCGRIKAQLNVIRIKFRKTL